MKVCVRLVLHVVERIRIVSPSDGTEKGAGTVKSANLVTDCRSHQIVLVNVAVAVLLEGFLSSIAEHEQEERRQAGLNDYVKNGTELDPLLTNLATYRSEEHLSDMIHRVFKHLDVDDSDSVSFNEFKEGLEKLDLEPQLYISYETYDNFTLSGALCDNEGCLTNASFSLCMRMQLRGYAQRIVAHQMAEAIKYGKDNSAEYFAQKVLLTEMFYMSQSLCPLSVEEIQNSHFSSAGHEENFKGEIAITVQEASNFDDERGMDYLMVLTLGEVTRKTSVKRNVDGTIVFNQRLKFQKQASDNVLTIQVMRSQSEEMVAGLEAGNGVPISSTSELKLLGEIKVNLNDYNLRNSKPIFQNFTAPNGQNRQVILTVATCDQRLTANEAAAAARAAAMDMVASEEQNLSAEANSNSTTPRSAAILLAKRFKGLKKECLKDEIKVVFETFDESGDGVLQADEVQQALRGMGQILTMEQANAFVTQYSSGGAVDGLTLGDFEHVVRLMLFRPLENGLNSEHDARQALSLGDSNTGGEPVSLTQMPATAATASNLRPLVDMAPVHEELRRMREIMATELGEMRAMMGRSILTVGRSTPLRAGCERTIVQPSDHVSASAGDIQVKIQSTGSEESGAENSFSSPVSARAADLKRQVESLRTLRAQVMSQAQVTAPTPR